MYFAAGEREGNKREDMATIHSVGNKTKQVTCAAKRKQPKRCYLRSNKNENGKRFKRENAKRSLRHVCCSCVRFHHSLSFENATEPSRTSRDAVAVLEHYFFVYLRLDSRRRLCRQLVLEQVNLRHGHLCLLRLLLQLLPQQLNLVVRTQRQLRVRRVRGVTQQLRRAGWRNGSSSLKSNADRKEWNIQPDSKPLSLV